MKTDEARTAWGRARFGSGRLSALTVALPAGILLGAGSGWLAAALGIGRSNPVLAFVIFAACLVLPATALVYAVVVDRNTVRGATERPGESVEEQWYGKAAAGSFADLILGLGAAATVLAFIPAEPAVSLKFVLPAILAACFASFGIRYLLLRLRA